MQRNERLQVVGVLLVGVLLGYLATFKEFPPSQRAASFTIDHAMEKLRQGLGNK